jgi:hypothetical protein
MKMINEEKPGKVKLRDVRISFPDLFEAKSVEGSQPKFGAQFLIPKNSEAHKAVLHAMKDVAKLKWNTKAEAILNQLIAAGKTCLTDGDMKEYDGYAGNMCLSARSTQRPTVLDKDKSQLDSTSGRPYAGSRVNASVILWAQDNKFGKRINATLSGVQFFKDADPFSAGPSAASVDEFDDVSEDDDI